MISYSKDTSKQSEVKKVKKSYSRVSCECRVGEWMHRYLETYT